MKNEFSESILSPLPVPILTFHKIDSRFEWGLTRISPKQFQRIMQFLYEEGYCSVSLEQVCHSSQSLPEKSVVITFDDSYESIYSHAFPIMEKYGFTGTIFVITGYVGKKNHWDVNLGGITFSHLSWEQLRFLVDHSFEMGSHTVHHRDLTRIPLPLVEKELFDSKKMLEDQLGRKIRFVSFPFGRYNAQVLAMAQRCGYERGVGFWTHSENEKALVFERRAVYLFDGLWNIKAKLSRTFWTEWEDVKLRVINFFSHGTALVKSSMDETW